MAYLVKDDYTLRIAVDHLDEILEQAIIATGLTVDNVRANAEAWAQAFVKGYLVTKYNISAEFGLTGPGRNPIIMQVVIDLALCTLHKTINPRDIPEQISLACDAAVKWLEAARDGTIVVDLPPAPSETPGAEFQRSFIDSQEKFISKPYQDKSLFG